MTEFLGFDDVPEDTLDVDGIDEIDCWSYWDVVATTPEDVAEAMRQLRNERNERLPEDGQLQPFS